MGISDDTWRKIYAAFDPTARVEFDEPDLFVGRPGTVAMSIVDDLRHGLEPFFESLRALRPRRWQDINRVEQMFIDLAEQDEAD